MKILNFMIIKRFNEKKSKPISINIEKEKLLKEKSFISDTPKLYFLDIFLGILVAVINILFFMMNIYFLFHKKIIHIKKFNDLKDIDQFIFILLTNSYTQIGNYLNNKYNNSSDLIVSKKKKNKKIIHLYYVNMCFEEEFKTTLLWYLKDEFIIVFDKDNPDYLVFNAFNYNELNTIYNNCIKIAIYTENSIPDLSNCDYALGHAHISYLDRYFTLPFCFLRRLNETKYINLEAIRKHVINKPRKKFCAALIRNTWPSMSDLFRLQFIEELNKYKQIDMGGPYNNNVGGPVKNKTEFLLDYKFSIAMENTNGDGYISEKIIDSFIAGTIPIYYGSYMIDEYINPKTYILINGPKDMYEKIEYIKKIDNDDDLYKSILKEKVYINDKILEQSHKEQTDFWVHIFKQDKNKAKRNFD